MSKLRDMLSLEYGAALSAEFRSGFGFPVFGSNGEVGRHSHALIGESGIVVGRKGSVGQVSWSKEPFWPIDTAYWVRCKPDDKRWLYWLLTYLPLRRLDTSTGVPGLNRNDVYELSVFKPEPAQQSKIAEILDTLDAAIRGTGAVVAKLTEMKQGLLHDLLTRGIDQNGDLRPPYTEAPHLYHQTPLGWLPKGWDSTDLGKTVAENGGTLQTGPFGAQLHAYDYETEGVPVIMPQDLIGGTVSISRIARVSEQKATAMARHRVQRNDIVFSRRGDLSRCAAITSEIGWICGTGCLLARFSSKRLLGQWFALNYDRAHIQTQVLGMAVGSTMANLNTSILSKIKAVLPPVDEQQEVVLRVAAAEVRLQQEQFLLAKLRLQKSGLMEDLLTGRVSVAGLLAPEGAAHGP